MFRQVARGAHPDLTVLEAERDPRTGRLRSEITVDAVRAATASLQMTAAAGGYRVAIVDGAESMNRNAANALLKTLEEPPRALGADPGQPSARLACRDDQVALRQAAAQPVARRRSSRMRSPAACRT